MVVAEAGMLLAAALALSQVKLFQLPQGGSVSIGSLPLLLLAARRGPVIGMAAGGVSGILAMIQKPFIVSPLQFLLDYPLAFATAGLAGIIPWKTRGNAVAGITLAGVVRLACHVISGVVFFSKPEQAVQAAIWASLAYNSAHLIPETLLCALAGAFLVKGHSPLTARQP